MMRFTRICAALVFALTASGVQAKDIKISHQFRQGDARDQSARIFITEVNKRDASLKFRIYPNRSLVSAPIEQLSAMRDGSVEMAIYPINYGAGQIKEFSVSTLPGLVKSIEHGNSLRDAEFGKVLQRVAMANGVRIVAWWWTPLGFVMREKDLTYPDRINGLKLRGADAYIDLLLRERGASVVAMAGTELYSAMQSGILDGFVTSTESMLTSRFYEVGKSATLGGGFSFATSLQPLMMSRKHWDELSNEQKAAFEAAARASEVHFSREQEKATDEAVAAFKKANVRVHAFSKEEHAAWLDAAKATSWASFAKYTADGAALVRAAESGK